MIVQEGTPMEWLKHLAPKEVPVFPHHGVVLGASGLLMEKGATLVLAYRYPHLPTAFASEICRAGIHLYGRVWNYGFVLSTASGQPVGLYQTRFDHRDVPDLGVTRASLQKLARWLEGDPDFNVLLVLPETAAWDSDLIKDLVAHDPSLKGRVRFIPEHALLETRYAV